jgi:hypothetical protein
MLSPLLYLVAIVQLAAQPNLKVCALLTPAELAGAGVTLTPRGLFADDPVTATRAAIPGLPADLRIAQCTSEYVVAIGDFPVRFSVMTASKALDRTGWDAVSKAIEDDDAPSGGTVIKVGEANCERLTQPSTEKGRTVAVLGCTVSSGVYSLTVEVARQDLSQLPAPAKVASLLTLMKQRLP